MAGIFYIRSYANPRPGPYRTTPFIAEVQILNSLKWFIELDGS